MFSEIMHIRTRGLASPCRWYSRPVRLAAIAPLLPALVLSACKGDEPGGIEASINQALIQVNPAAPDSNATLTLTVELQARGQPEEIELSSLTITQQPVSDSSESLTFEAHM